jgi:predicted aminopeptidase
MMDPRPSKRRRRLRWPILLLVLLGLVGLVSCTHVGYYAHSVWGGAKVLAKRKPVDRLIADESTPEDLRQRLRLTVEMREFAVERLGLPDNDSYRSYSDLERPYALWNVVAAPELSVDAKSWCFLFAGCVSYRGYFSEARAEKFAGKMRRDGYDVDVGGVTAYSTIGWFADPLLSTFIERPEPYLAGLIFHELAHQVAYVEGDSTFNESFAMAVEEEGAERWLTHRGLHDQIESYRLYKRWEKEFAELALSYRERLEEAYAADEPEDWKREQKARILDELRSAYSGLKESWGGYAGFDGWFDRDVNNARLALIGVYHELIPGFLALLETHGGDLESFYAAVEELAKLDRDVRHTRLEGLAAGGRPEGRTQ